MDEKDYYSVLQVAEDASTEDIKAAYRRLALEHHPDRADDPQATGRMQRINEAFAALVDPTKREQYDLERAIQFTEALEDFDGDPVEEEDPHRTQEIIVREVQFEKQQTWARSQLKIILRIFLFTSALFIWAMVSGQVNFAALILLVVISLQVIVSVMMRIRNFSAPGSADHK